MREKINRLAKGIVDGDDFELSSVPESVEDTVRAGELTQKELFITERQGRSIKGLAYSTNMRVRIHSSSFGGSRSRIAYEVDGRHLSREDKIEGDFCLVTNGGEKKIPYSFSIDPGVSGRVLETLKTPEDFARLTKEDPGLGLRLFEYQDFSDAPFMQDLHIRALYDGLRGRVNRQNQLEEFLVAIKAKEPVRLKVDQRVIRFQGLSENGRGELEIRAESWGCVEFEVLADGDFLEIPKKSFSSQDFTDGICKVPFVVNPGRLHMGKNLGAVRIFSVRENLRVPVEAVPDGEKKGRRKVDEQRRLQQYLLLRLEYEITGNKELLGQMQEELEQRAYLGGTDEADALRQAELSLLTGDRERAAVFLEGCRAAVLAQRLERRGLYCGFQYLTYELQQKDGQREALLRLLEKWMGDRESGPDRRVMGLLLRKLNPELSKTPFTVLDQMRSLFEDGCRSPFLYWEALRLYEQEPSLLRRLGEFELQVLSFGTKRKQIGEQLSLAAASLAVGIKQGRGLHIRLFQRLYHMYPGKELLGAVCSLLIRGNRREETDFVWYQRALEQGVSLTRLYEYFLYSLPKDYPYLLPKEVLLYFTYERNMDDGSRSRLYVNILRYMNPESALYRQYEREIEQFAMDQLLKSKMNRQLVVLYDHMIYKEMIDKTAAQVLPAVLKSYRVRLKNPNIRYVVVCYEEIEGEDMFPVENGTAYVSLFSPHPIMLFQDAYGNRYADMSYRKLPAMTRKDISQLEERCYQIQPEHPMLRLKECVEIMERGVEESQDAKILIRGAKELRLHPMFRRKLLSLLISYYQKQADQEDREAELALEDLTGLDLERLSKQERGSICEALIGQGKLEEAYEMICGYGWDFVRPARLLKLCSGRILNGQTGEEEPLLQLSCYLFSQGRFDGAVLDYLCEYFNGSTKQMFKVLSQCVRDHVELYDMPERLLAQMMFSGETDRMDQVFFWYAEGKQVSNQVVKAYFTMKSADYFLKEKDTGGQVFSYLERVVQAAEDKSRIPTIYLLALTRYYSTLRALEPEQARLCQRMVELLLAENRVFAYFRDLGRLVELPDSVMDKAIVEYRGSRDARPEIFIRILPDEEAFSGEEMWKVYPGIYVRQKVLFDGETLEYRIYETRDGKRSLVQEGSLTCDAQERQSEGSRFAALNEMGLCLSLREEDALKKKMKKYLTDGAVMEELFGLM